MVRSVVPEQPPDGFEFYRPGADHQRVGTTVRDDHGWARQPPAREDLIQDAGHVARVRVEERDDVHLVRCEFHVEPLGDLSDLGDVRCRSQFLRRTRGVLVPGDALVPLFHRVRLNGSEWRMDRGGSAYLEPTGERSTARAASRL